MNQMDFNFSRPLDFQKNIGTNILENLISSIKTNSSDQILHKHVKYLVLELYYCWYESENQFLSVSLSKRGYKAKSRYNPNKISSRMIDAIKLLKNNGLIDYFPGFFDEKKKISRQTRIRASKEVIQEFKNKAFYPNISINHKRREVLFLREKNKLIEYKDDFNTHEIREIISFYNSIIEKTLFDIPILNDSFVTRADGKKIAISPTNSTCEANYEGEIGNRLLFSGSWWNKLDYFLLNKYEKFFCINNNETGFCDLSDYFVDYLNKTFNKNFSYFKKNRPSYFKNQDQLFQFVCKGFSSKNLEGLYRSFLNDRTKLDLPKSIDRKSFRLMVSVFLEKNRVFSELFFKNKSTGWHEFLNSLCLKLIKTFASSKIPVFLIKNKLFFPYALRHNVIPHIENILVKSLNPKKISIELTKCYNYSFNTKKILNSILNKKEVSSRYLKKSELFIKNLG